MRANTLGALIAAVILLFVGSVGGYTVSSQTHKPVVLTLTRDEQAVVTDLYDSTAGSYTPGNVRVLDRVTHGDVTMTVIEFNGNNSAGDISLTVPLMTCNGSTQISAAYPAAQAGHCPWQ